MQQQLCTIEYQNWLQWCNSIQLFHISFLRRNPIFLITKTKYIWVYDYSFCYLFILKRVVRVFILSYLLGGSHFLLSLQPTTTGVILSLYFMVNVRREVGTVNGLIEWWSNMSWVGGWIWQQVTSHHNDGKKVILNFHFLIARHWDQAHDYAAHFDSHWCAR